MATIETEDLSRLSERQLKKRIARDRKALREVAAVDLSPAEVRAGEGEKQLAQMAAVGAAIEAGERELRGRETRSFVDNAPLRRRARDEADASAARKAETAAAVKALNMIGVPPGAQLVASRLTRDEGEELLAIVLKWRKEELNAAEHDRRNELVAKAAGDPDLFKRHEREQALAEKGAKLAEQERLASLVQRPAPPLGSIVLPGELTHMLIEARDDGMTYERLGVLAGVLLGLEGHVGTLADSHYEDGALIVASDRLRFHRGDGSLAVADALTYLRLADWLEVERVPSGVRIAAGQRVKKLYGEEVTDNG